MNYKKELLKRLFKKLGKENDEKDLKSKTIRLSTTISFHDLETRKRQARNMFKTHQVLKFYMKVNVYDPENVQKGRMMLLNIAEDLKEDCKMTVSPAAEEEKKSVPGDKKPKTLAEMEKGAAASKAKREQFVAIQHGDEEDLDYDSDMENRPQYLYMELKSTSTFKDIDIDAMLEHTTFDEFMAGLYMNKVQ